MKSRLWSIVGASALLVATLGSPALADEILVDPAPVSEETTPAPDPLPVSPEESDPENQAEAVADGANAVEEAPAEPVAEPIVEAAPEAPAAPAPAARTAAVAAPLLGTIGALEPWSADTNQVGYWEARYTDHQAVCYKHEGNSDHGAVTDNGKTVTLATFNQAWPGDHWEALIVKGGSISNNVIVHPTAGVPYASPLNDGGNQSDVSHWIVCKGTTPILPPPPPPVLNACTPGQGDTSTDLNDRWSNVDTRADGHLEYVDGGLHVWTTSNGSQAKVSEGRALTFPLHDTGTVGIDWTGSTPPPGVNLFVNFGADGNGTLVYEGVYGQDLWLTNGSSAAVKAKAPSHTGGNGSENHGTINEWLSVYPDATVTGVAYSLGSGVLGDGVIHSITVNCATYLFDKVDQPEATPPLIVVTEGDWTGAPECGDEVFTQSRDVTTTTTTYRVDIVDGGYVIVANEPTSVTVTETREVGVDEPEACPTETPTPTPTPTDTPTTTPSPTPSETALVTEIHTASAQRLASTGTDGLPYLAGGVVLLITAGTLLVLKRRKVRA